MTNVSINSVTVKLQKNLFTSIHDYIVGESDVLHKDYKIKVILAVDNEEVDQEFELVYKDELLFDEEFRFDAFIVLTDTLLLTYTYTNRSNTIRLIELKDGKLEVKSEVIKKLTSKPKREIRTVALEFTPHFFFSDNEKEPKYREDSYKDYKIEYVKSPDYDNYFQIRYKDEIVTRYLDNYFHDFLYLEDGYFIASYDAPRQHDRTLCHLEHGVIVNLGEVIEYYPESNDYDIVSKYDNETFYKLLEFTVPMYERLLKEYNEKTAK